MFAFKSLKYGEPLRLVKVSKPKIEPGKVLVKMICTGICHTDIHSVDGDFGKIGESHPYIPGHEGIGIIEEIADNVKHLHNIGDKVGIAWLYSACGKCEYCKAGKETLCYNQKNSGYSVDGTFAEYCLADAEYVAKLPQETNDFELAPILCAGVTVYKALKTANLKPNQKVGIIGIGGLGSLAIKYAQKAGLQVCAYDIKKEALQLAEHLCCDSVNLLTDEKNLNLENQLDGIICTASSLEAFKVALSMLKPGGVFIPLGLPKGNFDVNIADLVLKEKRIIGSLVGTREDMKEALQIALTLDLPEVKKIIADTIPFWFEELKKGNVVGRLVAEF